jgi:hypothetical protein
VTSDLDTCMRELMNMTRTEIAHLGPCRMLLAWLGPRDAR